MRIPLKLCTASAVAVLLVGGGSAIAQSSEETVNYINEKLQCAHARIDPQSGGYVLLTIDYDGDEARAVISLRGQPYRTAIRRKLPYQNKIYFKLTEVEFTGKWGTELECVKKNPDTAGRPDCVRYTTKHTYQFDDAKSARMYRRRVEERWDSCHTKGNTVSCTHVSYQDGTNLTLRGSCSEDTDQRLRRAFIHLRKVMKPKKELF